MNNKVYIDGIEVNLEFAGLYHDVKSKLALGVGLTSQEKDFYLLLLRRGVK